MAHRPGRLVGLGDSVGRRGLLEFAILRPPTPAELAAQQEAKVASSCQVDGATLALPEAMRSAYCRCIVQQSSSFGGLSAEGLSTCRGRAARGMTKSQTLEADFRVGMVRWCSGAESAVTGHTSSGETVFCTCVRNDVDGDPDRMVQFAYADGLTTGAAWDKTRQSCGAMLDYGSDWRITEDGGRLAATSKFPFRLNGVTLEFACQNGSLAFSARYPSGDAVDPPLVVADEHTRYDELDSAKAAVAPVSYQLLDQLMAMGDPANDRRYAYATFGTHDTTINMTGIYDAGRQLLSRCPEPVGNVAQALKSSDERPDPWRLVSSTMATTSETAAFQLTLTCDSVIGLEVGSDALNDVAVRYPGPTGTFKASNVPATILMSDGSRIARKIPCAYPFETAASMACFFRLQEAELAQMVQGDVAFDFDGYRLQPTMFGGSDSLRELATSCDRLP